MSKRLQKTVKSSLDKALDSALLAVEMYNKPAVKFKSAGFIVLMCIAWTSLFHAIFFNKKIKPFYKEKNKKRYEKINGEYRFWELNTCLKEYFKDNVNAIRKNIEFFIPLRNKIEHKFLPELDANIFAECQSFLFNFDKIVECEFGEAYRLRESLSFALQLFPSSKTLNSSIKQNKDAIEVLKFIEEYRSSISTEILSSGDFAFKAFLIQVSNHNSKEALPIQFFKYDALTDEEKSKVDGVVGLIQVKHVANRGTLKPKMVVEQVQKAIGNDKKFTINTHILCWRKYKVRPESNALDPTQTDGIYCIYDEPNKSYLYTKTWVNFLIEKMRIQEEYDSLSSYQKHK